MTSSSFEITGGNAHVRITLTETGGDIQIRAKVLDTYGEIADLRGMFLHIADESLLGGLTITGADVTLLDIDANNVDNFGGGVNINGDVLNAIGKTDIGVAFGTSGIGSDDIRDTTVTLRHSNQSLSLDDFDNQAFAVRLTSVGTEGGSREGSLKLYNYFNVVQPPPVGGPDYIVEGTEGDDFIGQSYDHDPEADKVDNSDHSDGSDDDSIEGGAGDDVILAGAGNDTVDGDEGADTIYGDAMHSMATVTTSATTRYGSDQTLTVTMTVPDDASCGPINAEGLISNTLIGDSYNIAIVVDTSGSTRANSGADVTGDDINDSILTVEKEAVAALVNAVVNDLGALSAKVGIIRFSTSGYIVGSYVAGADDNDNGTFDAIDAVQTLASVGMTNYEAGLQQAINYLNSQPDSGTNLVYFLSDGEPNKPSSSVNHFTDEVATLTDPDGLNAIIRAIGVGDGVTETKLDFIDDGIDNDSALVVTNLTQLSDALIAPPIEQADVDRVEFYVNGALAKTLHPGGLEETPVGLRYDTDLTGLVSGANDTVEVKVILDNGTSTTVSTSQTVEDGPACDDGDDSINSGNGSDIVYGMGGDDTLEAGSGDSIHGNDDADTINADPVLVDDNGSDSAGVYVDGGTGGNDDDTLDLTAYEFFQNLSETNDPDGNSTSGTVEVQNSDGDWIIVTFDEIENLLLPAPLDAVPSAVNDTANTDEDTQVTIDVLSNDSHPYGDDLTVTNATIDPAQGTISINPDYTLNFVPAPNFNGSATINYTIEDENGDTASATVTVLIRPVDDDPIANNDTSVTAEDTPVTVDLLANDTHPDDDELTVVSAKVDPSTGTLVDNGDGTVTFTPVTNYNGSAVITYTIEDENGDTDTATHTIDITPVDDVLTEDIWFHAVPCSPNQIDGMKTEWKYHGGSDKLSVDVTIKIDGIFGDGTGYTFDGVETQAFQDIFESFGVTSYHKFKVKVADDEIRIRIVARDLPLTDAQIATLPGYVDTPVQVTDIHGITRGLDVCVQFDATKIYSPVAFDLNGNKEIGVTGPSTGKDRVDLTPGDAVYFDMDGDGTLDRIEWLSGDGDALLVDNRDGNAATQMTGLRLFGDEGGTYANGYEKLAQLDVNDDDLLTGAELNGLALWADDGDALVEIGELRSVQDRGIQSITVTYQTVINDHDEELVQSGADIGIDGVLEAGDLGADLQIIAISARDASLSKGQTLRVDMTVTNQGDTDASGVRSKLYWSANDSFDIATAVKLDNDGHGKLDVGEVDDNEKFKVSYDAVAGLGNGYLFAMIDANGKVDEWDETNNVSDSIALTITDSVWNRADLSIQTISLRDDSLDDGQRMVIDLVVENTGESRAKGVQTKVFWNETDTFDFGTAIELATDGHGSLNIGEVDGNEKVRIDHDDLAALGDGFIFAMIDARGTIAEQNEDNNVSDGLAFTLNGSGVGDAQILDLRADDTSLNEGQRLRLEVDVSNTGTGNIEDIYTDVYWSATDTFNDATAVLLDKKTHQDLDAGEVAAGERVKVTYNDLADLGSGYIFAHINAPDGEADTGNNLSGGLYIEIL